MRRSSRLANEMLEDSPEKQIPRAWLLAFEKIGARNDKILKFRVVANDQGRSNSNKAPQPLESGHALP